MSGITRRDRIRKDSIRGTVKVGPKENEVQESKGRSGAEKRGELWGKNFWKFGNCWVKKGEDGQE